MAKGSGVAIGDSDMSPEGRIGLPSLRRPLIVEAEYEMMEAGRLTKSDRGTIARRSACEAVEFCNPPLEILFMTSPDSPTGNDGDGLIRVC